MEQWGKHFIVYIFISFYKYVVSIDGCLILTVIY